MSKAGSGHRPRGALGSHQVHRLPRGHVATCMQLIPDKGTQKNKKQSPAIKKNEIMPFAATGLDLEIIILSEVSQTEKDKYHMISLIGGIERK